MHLLTSMIYNIFQIKQKLIILIYFGKTNAHISPVFSNITTPLAPPLYPHLKNKVIKRNHFQGKIINKKTIFWLLVKSQAHVNFNSVWCDHIILHLWFKTMLEKQPYKLHFTVTFPNCQRKKLQI